jgi:peptide deformylase
MPQAKSDLGWAAGKSALDIVTIGHPDLRKIADDFKSLQDLRHVVDTLVSRLRELNGAGLAAPQLGIRVPVAVVEVRKTDLFPDRPESPLYVLIRPVIEDASGPEEEGWEGCFSVPGLMGKVSRSSSIRVKFLTLEGEEKVETFSGYLARVVQHEIDHLNGKLFVDRMTSSTSLTTVDNWNRFNRDPKTP